jgi:hypothetical protein
MAEEQKVCFVICPIGERGSPTRKRSDQVMKYLIALAAKKCGYKAVRAHEIFEPGIISNQVIRRLGDAPLVIADLTEANANVFYELAIRHVARKALVQIIEDPWVIPFDVSSNRTIRFDHTDLDSVAAARKELVKQIQAVEKDPTLVDNPIASTIDVEALRGSGKPVDAQLAAVVEAVNAIAVDVAQIKRHQMRGRVGPFMSVNWLKDKHSEMALSKAVEEIEKQLGASLGASRATEPTSS